MRPRYPGATGGSSARHPRSHSPRGPRHESPIPRRAETPGRSRKSGTGIDSREQHTAWGVGLLIRSSAGRSGEPRDRGLLAHAIQPAAGPDEQVAIERHDCRAHLLSRLNAFASCGRPRHSRRRRPPPGRRDRSARPGHRPPGVRFRFARDRIGPSQVDFWSHDSKYCTQRGTFGLRLTNLPLPQRSV